MYCPLQMGVVFPFQTGFQALGEKKPNSKPKKLHLGGLVLGIVEGTSHILHQFPIVLVVLATAQ